jgi:hypothetical protein
LKSVIILFFTAVSTAAGLEDRGDGVEGTGDRVDAAADAGLEDNGDGVGDGVEGTSDRVDAAAAAGLEDNGDGVGDGVEVTGDGVDAAATTSAGGSAARASLETETGSFNR